MQSRMKDCLTTIQPGEFWVADIPFTDASSSKILSLIILSSAKLENTDHISKLCPIPINP